MKVTIDIDDKDVDQLYHALNGFRSDFELINDGEMSFTDLQNTYNKGTRHLKEDMESIIRFAFAVTREMDRNLSLHEFAPSKMTLEEVSDSLIKKTKEPEIRYIDETVDVYEYDRTLAILVADGEIYISDGNHQECLLDYLEEHPTDIGIDFTQDYDGLVDDLIEVTSGWFANPKIDCYGFDVFEIHKGSFCYDFLLAHHPENLISCYEMMSRYAEEHRCILGTFVTCNDYNVKIVDSEKNREILKFMKAQEDRERE